ncbi:hypothetical protein FSP39_018569 [Pinctada imbricata]|uniref:Deacetylase sirtuin-type domain-containing protein n=1 Tax=Pinctada imbricata TaxID=66713 RepID=A0AA88XSX8_PINIB|nr:hypothetical protein FSP39_018569 [Pinctada imbricata]
MTPFITSRKQKVHCTMYKIHIYNVGFAINWDDNGMATFHFNCWKIVRSSIRDTESTDRLIVPELEKQMITEAMKTAELHNPYSIVKLEAERICNMLNRSKYCIAFTGAGISTAAGIGDYRGITGKWTQMDKTKLYGQKGAGSGGGGFRLTDLRPTYTHEALVKLMEMGILKFLISQNTDGLHQLSGILPENIAELHGNAFVEKCEKCGRRYQRNLRCRPGAQNVPPKPCERCRINHRTGNVCEDKTCSGYLMNTIINFGDYLEQDILASAEQNARRADLVLCLGSTLRVSPANSLVAMGKEPIRLIICNRQVTPFDEYCLSMDKNGRETLGSRVYGDCDILMREVMKRMMTNVQLIEWEKARDVRMGQYNAKRST